MGCYGLDMDDVKTILVERDERAAGEATAIAWASLVSRRLSVKDEARPRSGDTDA